MYCDMKGVDYAGLIESRALDGLALDRLRREAAAVAWCFLLTTRLSHLPYRWNVWVFCGVVPTSIRRYGKEYIIAPTINYHPRILYPNVLAARDTLWYAF